MVEEVAKEMRMQIYLSIVAHGWARHEAQEIAERKARRHAGKKKGCQQITYLIKSEDGETPFDATEVWVDLMGGMRWPHGTVREEVNRIGFKEE